MKKKADKELSLGHELKNKNLAQQSVFQKVWKFLKGPKTKMKHSLLPSWFVYLLIERG